MLNPYLKSKTIIPDTSPLLLILMGLYDKEGIESFKRLSNFAGELKQRKFSEFSDANRPVLEKINEEYISKTNILNENDLVKFGFTDTSIILAARKNNALILTDDFPLNGMCKKIGLNSIHIDEILSQKEIFEK